MKYEKLKAMAATLTAEEVVDSLRSLAQDNRFAAVVHLIQEQKYLAHSQRALNQIGSRFKS